MLRWALVVGWARGRWDRCARRSGGAQCFCRYECFSPCDETGRGRRCASWRVGGACAAYGCAVLLLVGGGWPSVGAGILVVTRSFDGLSGRGCERVMRNYVQGLYT